jgi:hypothetical protein
LEDNQRLLSLIERSAQDLPDLAALYFHHWRRGQVSDLAGYLGRRIEAGYLRPVPDVPIAARFMVETIAWFAWHRHRDPDSAMIGDVQARASVTALLLAAFVPESTPPNRSGTTG